MEKPLTLFLALQEAQVPRILREVEAMVALGAHPQIVTLHKSFFSLGTCKLYLVYEPLLLTTKALTTAFVRAFLIGQIGKIE